MRYEWDENKNDSNLEKHGLSFETASLVFDDPNALSIPDRIENGEERWQTIGMKRKHCDRHGRAHDQTRARFARRNLPNNLSTKSNPRRKAGI
jgi:Ribonuclease toxin, BrnT, of type II toxin-antitoxin system